MCGGGGGGKGGGVGLWGGGGGGILKYDARLLANDGPRNVIRQVSMFTHAVGLSHTSSFELILCGD